MQNSNHRYERAWGTGMIIVGIVLLGVVFFLAFGILRDPGGYYDRWVPGDDVAGPEASYDWTASGLDVAFTDTSQGGDAEIERWVWDFGDGVETSDPNPSYRFGEDGEHGVTLEVVDTNGLTSKAEGTVEVETGAPNSGDGAIGLSDMADNVIETVERSSKGGLVVVLVIGMLVVLTMIGGRVVRQGVRMLRPLPDRITMKLRPKELELAAFEPPPAAVPAGTESTEPTVPAPAPEAAEERVEAGV